MDFRGRDSYEGVKRILNSYADKRCPSLEKENWVRLYDDKRRKISIGDKIIFSNIVDDDTLVVIVKALFICETFRDLFEEISSEECGNPKDMPIESAVDHMREYYSLEDEQKYGVIGIKIVLINMN